VSFDRLIDDLTAVIDASQPQRFSLLGVAGGCAIAVAYAVRFPERVERLILYGGFTRGAIARSVNASQREEAQTYLKLVELGGAREDPAFRQLFTAQFIPGATPEQSQAFNELMRLAGGSRAAASVLRVLHEVDIRTIAPRVRCPTLVLHPTENFRVPFEEGRALAALIPKARLVPLESRNFIMLQQEPAWSAFVTELEGFLEEPGSSRDVELDISELTERERQILELLAQGLDNGSIANRLGIGEKTVRNRVSLIMDKLNFDNRMQAIVRAREAGFGQNER
jgi:DNA-binding CsgD family transcriptional regulator/pimeloyl-ACP methyl ester carboxylesterase